MGFKNVWNVVLAAFQEWKEDNASELAASLSYYTAVSIAPLLIFFLLLLGFVVGEGNAADQLIAELQVVMGPQGTEFIESIINNSDRPVVGSVAGVVSLLTLIWGSTNVFAHLQNSLNSVWDVEPKPNSGIMETVRRRFLSLTLVLGVGFLLAVSLVLTSIVSVAFTSMNGGLPGSDLVWHIVETVGSVAVLSLLFGAIFKILPDVEIAWRSVWLGALLTALLFTLGQFLISLYLGSAGISSTYGAAGSVIAFLLWVFYSALILFFGAEVTQVVGRRFGTNIDLSEHAVHVDAPVKADR